MTAEQIVELLWESLHQGVRLREAFEIAFERAKEHDRENTDETADAGSCIGPDRLCNTARKL